MKPDAAKRLKAYFRRNGYIREANPKRKAEGASVYKKGCEVRLVLKNDEEMGEVVRALKAVALKPGKAFLKQGRPVVPIYGKAAVDWFKDPA